MLNPLARNKQLLIAGSMVLMMACLFVSRAFLSISMFLFLGIVFFTCRPGATIRNFLKNGFLISITIFFWIPFISFFWSENRQEWLEIIRIKLPLLLFPLAFAADWQLEQGLWRRIMLAFLGIMIIATGWSLFHYLVNMQEVNESYLRSKTIRTPLEDDHVRFSWMVAVAALISLVQAFREKAIRWMYVYTALFFIVYLHLLAARMGLFSLYIGLGIATAWLMVKKKKAVYSISLLAILILVPVFSYFLFPTLRNRIQYFLYDISHVQQDTYLPGSNDGTRIQSLKAGWHVLKENPLGVGAGDLKQEVFSWYQVYVPAMQEGFMFLPCSEWLIYGGFAGWPGLLAVLLVLILPFFYKPGQRLLWVLLHVLVVFSFAFDMMIEAQFGVFIYLLLVLWWWKWFQLKTDE